MVQTPSSWERPLTWVACRHRSKCSWMLLAPSICREALGGQSRRRFYQWRVPWGDKQNSLVQLMTFAAQHQMHWVNLGMNYGNNRSYTNEDILNRDSYTLGMAGQADMDQSGDVAPPSSDLRTAEFLGRRVAEVAQELSAGRATLGRPANRGVSGGADNQDPEGRGGMASKRNRGTSGLVTV